MKTSHKKDFSQKTAVQICISIAFLFVCIATVLLICANPSSDAFAFNSGDDQVKEYAVSTVDADSESSATQNTAVSNPEKIDNGFNAADITDESRQSMEAQGIKVYTIEHVD